MDNKYFTVVFEIGDKAAFQKHLSDFTAAMMDDSVFPGATVSGCGWGDSMTEAEIYSQELTDNDIDLPEIPE